MMGSYALEFANPQHLIRQATGFLNECGFLRIPFSDVAKNSFFCDRSIQNQVTMQIISILLRTLASSVSSGRSFPSRLEIARNMKADATFLHTAFFKEN